MTMDNDKLLIFRYKKNVIKNIENKTLINE